MAAGGELPAWQRKLTIARGTPQPVRERKVPAWERKLIEVKRKQDESDVPDGSDVPESRLAEPALEETSDVAAPDKAEPAPAPTQPAPTEPAPAPMPAPTPAPTPVLAQPPRPRRSLAGEIGRLVSETVGTPQGAQLEASVARKMSRMKSGMEEEADASSAEEAVSKQVVLQAAAASLPLEALREVFEDLADQALEQGCCCETELLDGGVLCVSLASCRERREHTAREMQNWGFPEPHFVDALGPQDEKVLDWFNSKRVAKFPPCFRCAKVEDCRCRNNVMLLEQVANWLSFRKAWREIADSPYEWFLLVEDDVKFTHRAADCWNALVTPDVFRSCAGAPCIIRCGWQLGPEYVDDMPPELLAGQVRMSNHCSILNRGMARALLAGSEKLLRMTSDVFTHEHVAVQHHNFTMMPPISYDLSFALKVSSLIRPKGIDSDDAAQIERMLRVQRIEPQMIHLWLDCLVWVRDDEENSDCLLWSVSRWEDLNPRSVPVRQVKKLSGARGVVCMEPPPEWLYAGRRFYIGEEEHRPREFRPIDLREAVRLLGSGKPD